MLIAGAVTIPVGALVSIVAIRFGGIYVAIATFGFAIAMQQVGYYTSILFGQQQRIDVPRPEILGIDFTNVVPFYYLCLAVAVPRGAVVLAVRASRLGGLLRAMSDSLDRPGRHGANTTLIKVVVFCISAFLAGLGGVVISGVPQNAAGRSPGRSVSPSRCAGGGTGLRRAPADRLAGSWPRSCSSCSGSIRVHSEGFLKYRAVIFGSLAIFVAISHRSTFPGLSQAHRRRAGTAGHLRAGRWRPDSAACR